MFTISSNNVMIARTLFFVYIVICLTGCQELEDKGHSRTVRQKRAIGSILAKVPYLLVWTTNNGLSIAHMVSGGCSSFPSICTDRDAIERLDDEIKYKKKKFDAIFSQNGRSYVDLRQAVTNDKYLSLYMNRTMSALDRIIELSKMYVGNITLDDYAAYSRKSKGNGVGVTPANYMEDITGQLEASLHSITEIVSQDPYNQLLGTAVQMFVESLLNRFMRSVSEVYGSNQPDSFYKAFIRNMFNEGGVGNQNEVKFLTNMNLMSKVFKRIGTTLEKYFPHRWRSLKYWSNVNSWEDIKSKYKHTIRDPIQLINFEQNLLPLHREKEVNGIAWGRMIPGTLKSIGISIKIALRVENWKKVASEMASARQQYKDYKDKLSVEIQTQEANKVSIDTDWETTTRVYKQRIESFRNFLVELNDNTNFNGIFGLANQLTDSMSNYIPPNLYQINRQNLISNQQKTLGYLQNIYNGFIGIHTDLNVRIIMYNSVRDYVEKSKTITYMLQSLKNIYKYRTGPEKSFGAALVETDVVCTVAILFPQKMEYDFYSLESFRPSCDVTADMRTAVQNKRDRSLMTTVVTTMIKQDSVTTLQALYNSVKNAYLYSSNVNLRIFGSSITEKDVVCVLATEFSTRETFDFIPLASFRPTCAAVTDTNFQVLKQKRLITEQVKSVMDLCDSYSHCPCILNISSMIRQNVGVEVTENDVKETIARLKPDLVNYCGTTGCSCVNLL